MRLRVLWLVPLIVVAAACGGGSSRSKGSTVTMPGVVGLTQRDAVKRFAGVRITVYVYPERNPKIPKGVVFHQTPGPGAVPKGTLSAIYVSAGPHGPRVGKPFIAHR